MPPQTSSGISREIGGILVTYFSSVVDFIVGSQIWTPWIDLRRFPGVASAGVDITRNRPVVGVWLAREDILSNWVQENLIASLDK